MQRSKGCILIAPLFFFFKVYNLASAYWLIYLVCVSTQFKIQQMLSIKSRYISLSDSIFFQLTDNRYADFAFPRHFHEHYSIQIIHEGINIGFTERNEYRVEKHGLLIINPGDIHGGTTPKENALHYTTFRIDPSVIDAIMRQNQVLKSGTVFFDTSPIYSRRLCLLVLNTLESIQRQDHDTTEENFTALIMQLLNEYSNQNEGMDGSEKHPAILRAQAYIHENYDQSFTLHDLAKEAFISPYHLIRQFKKIRGVTPFQYLRNLRVEKAKKLMRQYSISEAASSVGFCDHSHFLKSFKQIEGLAPSTYRSSVH